MCCMNLKLPTWVRYMNQASKSIWDTACQVFHTFGNQTQQLWRGSLKSHKEDMKGQPPNFPWTDYTHLNPFSLLSESHCGTLLLLLRAWTQAELGKTERIETEYGPWYPYGTVSWRWQKWEWPFKYLYVLVGVCFYRHASVNWRHIFISKEKKRDISYTFFLKKFFNKIHN